MIELFYAPTPNGKKISIMLEEIGFEYKITQIKLNPEGGFSKGEQFKPEFRKISPFSKIPVIIDHDNNKEVVFESGAILMYLGEKSNKFYEQKDRTKINNFLTKKNSFIFESVEKRRIRGRYTIIGADPDKIWEFNKKKIHLIENKKKKIIKNQIFKSFKKIN